MNTQFPSPPAPETLRRWARLCRILAGIVALLMAWILIGSTARILFGEDSSWTLRWGLTGNVFPLLIVIPWTMLPAALLAWAVAQYLDYLGGAGAGGGWFGRHLPALLMLVAAGHVLIALDSAILEPVALFLMNRRAPEGHQQPILYNAMAAVLGSLTHALFMFGMADLLRRSRAVVDEARTLV